MRSSWRPNSDGEASMWTANIQCRSNTTTLDSKGFRADLLVEDKIIVEIKSVESIAPVHKMQLLTYLRLADKRLGLLINFNVALIKDGIYRVVNGLDDHAETPRTQSLKQANSRASQPGQKSAY
jgi:hypothetical protein